MGSHVFGVIDFPRWIRCADLGQNGCRKFVFTYIPLCAEPVVVLAEIHILAASFVYNLDFDFAVIIFCIYDCCSRVFLSDEFLELGLDVCREIVLVVVV